MNVSNTPIDETIWADSQLLSQQLQALSERLFSPEASKELRLFSSKETANLIGVTDGYIRLIANQKDSPIPEKTSTGRRMFTLEEIHELRRFLAKSKPAYLPNRKDKEHLQVIAVTNFKGGSGKTTTAVHLAQHLALKGYRVLAIDQDPQASLSAMLGCQPELDVGDNETLYGAIRYDDERRPIQEIIRKTYFAGLDFIPGNIELMEFEHDTPRHLSKSGRDPRELFFMRVSNSLNEIEENYDVVVIDCPPQLGFLTMSALSAATSVLITVHPQMLDVASMSQFLSMTSNMLRVVREAGANLNYDWLSYLVTRHEPHDAPQAQIVAFLRSLFGERVLTSMMLKSTAISDAGLSKQTIYEAGRETMNRKTYDRAMDAMVNVNSEIEMMINRAWNREPS